MNYVFWVVYYVADFLSFCFDKLIKVAVLSGYRWPVIFLANISFLFRLPTTIVCFFAYDDWCSFIEKHDL